MLQGEKNAEHFAHEILWIADRGPCPPWCIDDAGKEFVRPGETADKNVVYGLFAPDVADAYIKAVETAKRAVAILKEWVDGGPGAYPAGLYDLLKKIAEGNGTEDAVEGETSL